GSAPAGSRRANRTFGWWPGVRSRWTGRPMGTVTTWRSPLPRTLRSTAGSVDCAAGTAAAGRSGATGSMTAMREVLPILLLGLAGFLSGGVYVTWRNSRALSVVLAVLALLALAGGVTWLLSG